MSQRMTFQEAANAVKQRLDIMDVIGRHVALRKAGRSYVGLCPFHQEKGASFNVSPEKQLYNCFGCGEGGDTLSFLMKIESKTYGEVITHLAEEHGIEIIREGRQQAVKDEQDVLMEQHILAQTYYEEQLQKNDDVRAYLDNRKITPEWQTYFGLGYAPAGWENLVKVLRNKVEAVKQNPRLMERAGLANIKSETSGYYDRFRNRLMIPIQDDRGKVVAFGGRALSPEDTPKYLNSPETAIYIKNRILYGFAQGREAIRSEKFAILMEGYFDVISAHMAGLPQAVGVCGTALTEQHLKLLQRVGAETLYLCFDSDEAGQTAALRAIELVQYQLLEQGLTLKVITLPGEKDPDDFLKTQGKERFVECMKAAPDFLTFKFEKTLSRIALATPEGRIQAVQALTPMLAEIRQPVIRHEYINRLAERLQLTAETLLLELKRYEQQNGFYQNKKSHENNAIFFQPERYIGRKRWDKPQKQRKPEDMTVFRQTLSLKLPVEEKEHLLLSYLFINEESYRLVKMTLDVIKLESPRANALLEAIKALGAEWTTVNELIQQLSVLFHAREDNEMLQFLAHRVMAVDELAESYENKTKGLKSFDYREKLNRDIDDIVSKIQTLRNKVTLKSLAQNGRQHEQQSDDQLAYQIQLQLREELAARRSKAKGEPQTPSISLEEEQGV
jgi:DNA primase